MADDKYDEIDYDHPASGSTTATTATTDILNISRDEGTDDDVDMNMDESQERDAQHRSILAGPTAVLAAVTSPPPPPLPPSLLDQNDDEEGEEVDEPVRAPVPMLRPDVTQQDTTTTATTIASHPQPPITDYALDIQQQQQQPLLVSTRDYEAFPTSLLTDIATYASTTAGGITTVTPGTAPGGVGTGPGRGGIPPPPPPSSASSSSIVTDRFRNALARVQTHPTTDVEAWQALLTEASTNYRVEMNKLQQYNFMVQQIQIQQQQQLQGGAATSSLLPSNLSLPKIDVTKFDLMEAMYGALLQYFPYSGAHYTGVTEVLMQISALPSDDNNINSSSGGYNGVNAGGDAAFGEDMSVRRITCEKKMEHVFRLALGINLDGTPYYNSNDDNLLENLLEGASATATATSARKGLAQNSSTNAIYKIRYSGNASSYVPLWMLYIQRRTRDATRKLQQQQQQQQYQIQMLSYAHQQQQYQQQQQLQLLKNDEMTFRQEYYQNILSSYEISISHPAGFVNGCYNIWRQYLNFLRQGYYNSNSMNGGDDNTSSNNNNNAMLFASPDPQVRHLRMIQLRSAYQRCIGIPMQNLDEIYREYESFERELNEALAQALLQEHLPRVQHAKSVHLERKAYMADLKQSRLPIPPENNEAERLLIMSWHKRIAYERTNPERLSATPALAAETARGEETSSDLSIRVRQIYKDAVAILMRHPEIWHEWSTWEYVHGDGYDAAIQVIKLAQEHNPYCSLLVGAQAELLELQPPKSTNNYGSNNDEVIRCLEDFVIRFPCSVGFIMLQRAVRRLRGVEDARRVFRWARQCLVEPMSYDGAIGLGAGVSATLATSARGGAGGTGGAGAVPGLSQGVGASGNGTIGGQGAGSGVVSSFGIGAMSGDATGLLKRSIVMSRVKMGEEQAHKYVEGTHNAVSINDDGPKGNMTWHVFAAHAHIELRHNGLREVASRIFEHGIAKHRSFLSCPPYILAYARLLLEKGEDDNLRALLERSIAACEEGGIFSGSTAANAIAVKKENQRILWEMLLEFECNNARTAGDPKVIKLVEARRRHSLGLDEPTDMGISKDLQEQLDRTDGEQSGLIEGGLGRLLDRFELSGMLSQGNMDGAGIEVGLASGGGPADISFSKRYHGSSSVVSGTNTIGGMGTLDRSRAARERIQAAFAGQQSAASLSSLPSAPKTQGAITHHDQQPIGSMHPEYLRTLIILLPTSRFQRANTKPPPHMIEMALASLRNYPLPRKPTGPAANEKAGGSTMMMNGSIRGMTTNGGMYGGSISNKRKAKRYAEANGDSSDEDGIVNASNTGVGYSNQFRSRQRARQHEQS